MHVDCAVAFQFAQGQAIQSRCRDATPANHHELSIVCGLQPLLEEPDAPEARWEEPNAPGARWEGPEIAQQAVAGPSSTVLSNSLAAPSPGPSVFGSGALPTRGRPGLYSTTSWDAVSGLGATKRTFRRSATELAGARNGGRALHTAFAGSGSTSLASPRLLDCDRSLLQRKLVCPPTTSRFAVQHAHRVTSERRSASEAVHHVHMLHSTIPNHPCCHAMQDEFLM